MVVLDNLVVTTALPSIRADLGATLESLEWTVNAYTLTFAVLLLTGAALGDRFGRRRMFVVGLGALHGRFSAAAALAPTTGALIAARAFQGAGAAIVTAAHADAALRGVPGRAARARARRWSGISGLGVALGPLVGGAVVEGISWHWIFWLNVPIGLALVPLAARRLTESYGPAGTLDLPGLALAGLGLLGVVFGIVRGDGARLDDARPSSPRSAPAPRCSRPSSPGSCARRRRCCRCASSARARFTRHQRRRRCAMFFGVFGSIFLLAQFFQIVAGLLAAGGRAARRCRGRACRCSSRRSPGLLATGSARGR